MPFTRQAAALSRGLGVGKFNQLTDSSADERVLRNRDVGDDAPRSPDDGDGSYTFTDKARTFRMLPDPQPRGSNGYLPLSTAPTLHYDFRAQNVDLRPGEDVLLDDHTIMRIESWEINSGTPCINGVLFQPQSHPGLFMPTRENEFVAILQIDEETFAWKPWEQQVEARRVVSLCTLVVTNKPYQDLNYKRDVYNSDLAPKAVFFCRYMSASRKADAKQNNRERKPPRFGKIEHVTKADADNITLVARQSWMSSISNSDVRGRWRGDTKLDGSHVDTESGRQRYTFAEPFCGAGGVSVGAFNAGLELRWAFDQKEISMQTYRKNFQRAAKTQVEALTMDARDFVEKMSSRTCSPTAYMVDFMHMSPPCQPFAGCNRCADPAKQKEQLRAFNSVRGLLEYCKPRIVTLEEVDSLVNKDMEYWFKDLIYAFIEKGYSLQWKTFSLSEFGVPQTRDRFILIASGPGECLPAFIVPTHGEEGAVFNGTHGTPLGLRLLPSIGSALDQIPDDASDNDPRGRECPQDDRRSRDALERTIMTSEKPHHIHPDNDGVHFRHYTIREYASLQTFPHNYEFEGTFKEKLRQIGNDVPPLFATRLYEHVRSQLEQADTREMSARRRVFLMPH